MDLHKDTTRDETAVDSETSRGGEDSEISRGGDSSRQRDKQRRRQQ